MSAYIGETAVTSSTRRESFLRRIRAGVPVLALTLAVGLFALQPGAALANHEAGHDGDGDGFIGDDCDDTDFNVNPGVAEICGDGIDNNCDTVVDDNFVFDLNLDGDTGDGGEDTASLGDACVHLRSDGGFGGSEGECVTGSVLECNSNTLECPEPFSGAKIWQAESPEFSGPTPVGYGTCDDGKDNDCDGVIDLADLSGTPANGSICDFGTTEVLCDGVDEDASDGVDDDFTFTDALNAAVPVGDSCVAGIGECQNTGAVVCAADQVSTQCTAVSGSPGNEGIAFPGTCNDGLDNDCDGLTDGADTDDCPVIAAEVCDGDDNDGDGVTDEGFPGLGLACVSGTGACQVAGTNVCNVSEDGVVCNATPLSPPEPAEDTAALCSDGIDNDCNGAADGADANCVAGGFTEPVDLGVFCSLPYDTRGRPGGDCTGKHDVVFGWDEANFPGATIRADLLALDSEFNELNVFEGVEFGATAHLGSRVDPADWKWSRKENKRRILYDTFAPIPVLRVTGTLGSGPNAVTQQAFCAIRPYMDLTSPDGQTISVQSDGEQVLDVVVQIPLVDVDKLEIFVDGVAVVPEIEAALAMSAEDLFPTDGAGPLCDDADNCDFEVPNGCGDAGTTTVEVRNLSVKGLDRDIANTVKRGISEPEQVNLVEFELVGLPAGGHIVRVLGEPLREVFFLDPACNVDNLEDTGTMSAFGIRVDTPLDQETDVAGDGSDSVTGNICGGYEIASLSINGGDVDVSGQTCSAGNGETTAPECYFDFDYPIFETDLQDAIAGTASAGTFKRGTNIVIADGSDVQGNRTQNTGTIFAVGPVLKPPVAAPALVQNAAGGISEALSPTLFEVQSLLAAQLNNAFVVGLEENGASAFFNAQCVDAINTFTARATEALQGKNYGTFDIKPDCSCDLNNVPLTLEQLTFGAADPNTSCVADFVDDQINVTINLPDVTIQLGAHDSCETEGAFGECLARTTVDLSALVKLINLEFHFAITEAGILNPDNPVPPPPEPTFLWQVTDNSGEPVFNDNNPANTFLDDAEVDPDNNKNPNFDPVLGEPDVSIECWGAGLCTIGQFIVIGLAEVFTLSLIDSGEIFDFVGFDFEADPDFLAELKASEPDPMDLNDIKMDEEAVSEFGHAQYQVTISEVQIVGSEGMNENDGLVVAFSADVENQFADPEVGLTPGAVETTPPVPAVADVIDPEDIALMVSTDLFGQVFASMKDAGFLTNQCISSGKTVGDVLPADCETLGTPDGTPEGDPADPDTVAGATVQGLCHAIRGADCETLLNPNGNALEATEQGVCHGVQADVECSSLGGVLSAERAACNITPALNITAGDGLLLCVHAPTEPDLVFQPSSPDNTVPVHFLLNDLSAVFALDRGNDGYDGTIEDLNAKSCFKSENNAEPDCRVFAACLDLTVSAAMGIDNSQCAPGLTGFKFAVGAVNATGQDGSGDPDYGVICSAETATDDGTVEPFAATSDEVLDLNAAAEQVTPPFCAEGLTLGNVVSFATEQAKLFAISTDGGPIANFLGLGGTLGTGP